MAQASMEFWIYAPIDNPAVTMTGDDAVTGWTKVDLYEFARAKVHARIYPSDYEGYKLLVIEHPAQ